MTPAEPVTRRRKCRRKHLTPKQIEAISDAASIVFRMASSYEIYGGVNTKDCLATLAEITGEEA